MGRGAVVLFLALKFLCIAQLKLKKYKLELNLFEIKKDIFQ